MIDPYPSLALPLHTSNHCLLIPVMPARKKAKTSPNAKKQAPDFEQAMEELESLVTAMESGELSLEQSMEYFERGIQLTRSCQKSLSDAEQRVKLLVRKAGQEKLIDFDAE